MASYLSSYGAKLREPQALITISLIFMVPVGLILLQPDAGSALVFLSFLIVLFREGLSPNYFIIGGIVTVLFLLGLVFNTQAVILGLVLFLMLILAFNFQARAYWVGGVLALCGGVYWASLQENESWLIYALGVSLLAFMVLGYLLWRNRKARIFRLSFLTLVLGSGIAFAANYGFNNVLKPHQQDRINVWLQPQKCDPRGSLYNVIQSKMAISSGGFKGKGFLKGTMTKFNFVPEQSTDFIFCTVGEEQGFIGTFGIVVLFLLLLIRITILAERQRNNFARLYAYCVAGILFVHFFINIAMTMGLMPIIGIPLPFISKGGSSLVVFTIMLAVLLKLDSNRYRI